MLMTSVDRFGELEHALVLQHGDLCGQVAVGVKSAFTIYVGDKNAAYTAMWAPAHGMGLHPLAVADTGVLRGEPARRRQRMALVAVHA